MTTNASFRIKVSIYSHLITRTLLLLIFLRQHHPQGEEAHYYAMAEIPEHHGKQEGECDDGVRS